MGEEDLQHLETLVENLGPSVSDQEREELERAELDEMRWIVETMARSAGVDLDLSDLDLHSDPEEFECILHERFDAAQAAVGQAAPANVRQERPKEMAAVLAAGGGRAQSMIHQWADAHARTFC